MPTGISTNHQSSPDITSVNEETSSNISNTNLNPASSPINDSNAISSTTSSALSNLSNAMMFSMPSNNSIVKQINKLKRFLSTILTFGKEIDVNIGENVKSIVFSLLCNKLSIDQFQTKLQQVTHFPLKTFVTPFLKATLPLLQQELLLCSQLAHQSPDNFLNLNYHDYLLIAHSSPPPTQPPQPPSQPINGSHPRPPLLPLATLPLTNDLAKLMLSAAVLSSQQQQQQPFIATTEDSENTTTFSATTTSAVANTTSPSIDIPSHKSRKSLNKINHLKRKLSDPIDCTTDAKKDKLSSQSLDHNHQTSSSSQASFSITNSNTLTNSWKPSLISISNLDPLNIYTNPLFQLSQIANNSSTSATSNLTSPNIWSGHNLFSSNPLQSGLGASCSSSSVVEGLVGASNRLTNNIFLANHNLGNNNNNNNNNSNLPSFCDKLHKQWDQLLAHINNSNINNGQISLSNKTSNFNHILSIEQELISSIDEVVKAQEDNHRSILHQLGRIQDSVKRLYDDSKLSEMLYGSCNSNSIDISAIKRKFAKYYEEAVQEVQRVAQLELRRTMRILQDRSLDLVEQEKQRFQSSIEEIRRQTKVELSNLMMKQEDNAENCQNCGRRATEACSGCQVARYCGRFCQQKDWLRHKQECERNPHHPMLIAMMTTTSGINVTGNALSDDLSTNEEPISVASVAKHKTEMIDPVVLSPTVNGGLMSPVQTDPENLSYKPPTVAPALPSQQRAHHNTNTHQLTHKSNSESSPTVNTANSISTTSVVSNTTTTTTTSTTSTTINLSVDDLSTSSI